MDKKSDNNNNNNNQASSDNKVAVLKSAPPPGPAVSLWMVALALTVAHWPAMPSSPQQHLEMWRHFGHCPYPSLLPLLLPGSSGEHKARHFAGGLCVLRAVVAVGIWAVLLSQVLDREGSIQQVAYLPNSRLISAKNHMVGLKTLAPFTSVAWILLGISFTLSSYLAYQNYLYYDDLYDDDGDNDDDQPLLKHHMASPMFVYMAWCVWQMAAPLSLLVTVIVSKVLWPNLLRRGSTVNLKKWRALVMHNANIALAWAEMSVWSHRPVLATYAAGAPLLGILYVLFSWCLANRWTDSVERDGPQFLYFFLDTTLGARWVTLSLLALISTLLIFQGLLSKVVPGVLSNVVDPAGEALGQYLTKMIIGGSPPPAVEGEAEGILSGLAIVLGRILVWILVGRTVMRFRD